MTNLPQSHLTVGEQLKTGVFFVCKKTPDVQDCALTEVSWLIWPGPLQSVNTGNQASLKIVLCSSTTKLKASNAVQSHKLCFGNG